MEDLKEVFYISYEMATHRFTNLATQHLEIPCHFLRTDSEGVIDKAYENDGVAFPTAIDGGHEGERFHASGVRAKPGTPPAASYCIRSTR